MSGRSRLVKPGNGHAMLRPAEHGPHGSGLRGVLRAGMRAAVPKVRIHTFQIERALHKTRENFVVGEIRCEAAQIFQVRIGNVILDPVPMFRTFS